MDSTHGHESARGSLAGRPGLRPVEWRPPASHGFCSPAIGWHLREPTPSNGPHVAPPGHRQSRGAGPLLPTSPDARRSQLAHVTGPGQARPGSRGRGRGEGEGSPQPQPWPHGPAPGSQAQCSRHLLAYSPRLKILPSFQAAHRSPPKATWGHKQPPTAPGPTSLRSRHSGPLSRLFPSPAHEVLASVPGFSPGLVPRRPPAGSGGQALANCTFCWPVPML